ncbi:hypothetical protein CD30_00630 [Ureibacillus massiliensis 4400831 = CIP 108448 = CCUG 49529]|uniref:Uncharacterized protein n=1 Tax=Ureibacillus massiliensis 4400831 = CIP 108448 = CCUG 49529 TaxID=1211035 RepID=A0A0A3J643_9BACL|nr:hypothetical protein CD30_00630 [Ureibacillus massiliensis 4400831 = CIP 108448 = CCUG 49529]
MNSKSCLGWKFLVILALCVEILATFGEILATSLEILATSIFSSRKYQNNTNRINLLPYKTSIQNKNFAVLQNF